MDEEENKLGLFQVIAFLVSGIVVLDTFAAPAAMGASAIGLWIIVTIFFVIPNGLINAELGSAYPSGLVTWVKESMGEFHATIAGWFYWVNVALWLPAVMIIFTFWFGMTYFSDGDGWTTLTSNEMLVSALVVNWVLIFTIARGLDLGVLLSTIGTIIKVVTLLIFGGLGLYFIYTNGIAGTGLEGSIIPDLTNISSIGLVTAIVFNLLGFELIASIGDKIKDAERTIPKAIVYGAMVVGALYIFGTIGVLSASTQAQLADASYIETALPYSLESLILNAGLPPIVYTLLMTGILYTLLSNMIAWVIGASEILEDLDFAENYKVFSERHPKSDTLAKSYYLLGAISSLFILLGFLVLDAAGEGAAFWTILAFSMVIFIYPYIYLTPAILKLRNDGKERAFTIPGGNLGLWVCAILNFLFIALALIMLFLEPAGDPTLYYSVVAGGTIILTAVGVWFYKDGQAKLNNQKD